MAVNKALICIVLAITLYTEGAVIRKQNLQNDRPIIGILSQELSDILPPSIKGDSYIAASYIKYIESAGARVVPILTNFTSDQVSQMFRLVNGILLPGGGAHIPTSRYFMNVRQVIELAITANSLGDYFPVWGTCLGFESMQHVIDPQIAMNGANAIDIALPLNFTQDAPQSRMFENMSDEMMLIFSRSPVTYNYHKMCISKESFYKSEKLSSFFKVLSVNDDRDGEVFVSTIEGMCCYFVGVVGNRKKSCVESTLGTNLSV